MANNFVILLCRSLLFSLGMITATVIHASLSILIFPLPLQQRYRFITLWSRFIIWWAKVSCGIHYIVHGLENIPSSTAIILCKHQSTWETLALQVIFPRQTWVLKKELLKVPFFGWALSLLEPIAIDRSAANSALDQLIKQGTQFLQNGRWVVIFPEGSRVAPGETRKYARGGAALAAASGYPIIPVAHNAGEFWPRGGFIKKPGTIQVYIGEPINSQNQTPEALNQLAKTWIENTMTKIAVETATD